MIPYRFWYGQDDATNRSSEKTLMLLVLRTNLAAFVSHNHCSWARDRRPHTKRQQTAVLPHEQETHSAFEAKSPKSSTHSRQARRFLLSTGFGNLQPEEENLPNVLAHSAARKTLGGGDSHRETWLRQTNWFRNPAEAIDQGLHDRATLSIFQCDDSNCERTSGKIDRQYFNGKTVHVELQEGGGLSPNKTVRGK